MNQRKPLCLVPWIAMHLAVAYFPSNPPSQVEEFRRRYDPTFSVIAAHFGIVFPVPESVGEATLAEHMTKVLRDWKPFTIHVGGLRRMPDHWLFLTANQGNDKLIRLYNESYDGVLKPFCVEGLEFTPHISMGLFLKAGRTYEMMSPKEDDFDKEACESALKEFDEADFRFDSLVDQLDLITISDDILEWMRGEREVWPTTARVERRMAFRL